MNIRKLLVSLALALSFLGLETSNAFAATELKTAPASWEIGETVLAKSETLKCSLKSTNFKLAASILGASVVLSATGIECPEATISNEVVEGVDMAVASGKLVYTGVTIVEPPGCSTPSKLTTDAIKSRVDMHLENGVPTGRIFTTTEPESGTTFATVSITGCALEGSYSVKGKTVGESTVETGQSATDIPVAFNAATNAAGSLAIGSQPATITGEVNRELTSGSEFRVTEK